MGLAGLLLVVVFAISACRSGPPPDIRFDPAETAFLDRPGTTTIKGEAFLPDESGDVSVRYAAGEIVRLIPASAYARARIGYLFESGKFARATTAPGLDADAEYQAHMRVTKADARGRFSFEKVPPGTYFITSQIVWKPKKSFFSEGGLIYDEVTVTGDETQPIEVIVSGK
jgi:hypothetical protein